MYMNKYNENFNNALIDRFNPVFRIILMKCLLFIIRQKTIFQPIFCKEKSSTIMLSNIVNSFCDQRKQILKKMNCFLYYFHLNYINQWQMDSGNIFLIDCSETCLMVCSMFSRYWKHLWGLNINVLFFLKY